MSSGTLKYILRRVAYMLPTLLGIIILTFVLFNGFGGDPALIKLGKHATPELLEEYDVVRGYDKPLIAGNWGRTRAYREDTFRDGLAAWRSVQAASQTNGNLFISAPGTVEVPAGFSLHPAVYRWEAEWSLEGEESGALRVYAASNLVAELELKPGASLGGDIEFEIQKGAEPVRTEIVVPGKGIEIGKLALRRKTRHVFDSQFFFYLRQLAHFDFGTSHEANQRVSTMILDGILPSLSLTVPMFIVGLIVSICMALICAFCRDTIIDRTFVLVSVVLMSVNYLVWIVLGQYILGYSLRIFPVWGYESAKYLILPCVIGVVSGLGSDLRFYRTVMLDEMYRDYVRTAFAKGVSKSGVLFKHVLKNAMIPILTSVVMAIPFLYTGSILLETFFGIPGLGRMGINAINSSDFDVVKALVLIGGVIYLIASLLTDICYALVDPRIKLK